MKLYHNTYAPNPRRVRIFIAEKGIADCELIDLNIMEGDNLKEDFVAKNPFKKVPVLELDNGLCIAEASAICRYLDEAYPENPLYGTSLQQRAIIDMWDQRMLHTLIYPAAMAFQHIAGYFKDRMNPIEEWGKDNIKQLLETLPIMEQQLANNEWVAGAEFSAADITAVCGIEFAKISKVRVGDEFPSIQRWYAAMKERPSLKA